MGAEPVVIRLLGGFEIELDGRVVTAADFERRSGAEIVQLLALAPNRSLHREQVIDRLWPDLALKSATNQFHKASSFARSGVGERTAIIIREEQVHLFADREVQLDVSTVEQASASDPGSVAAARAAYRGDLLPELPYAEWAIGARDRIRGSYLQLLEAVRAWDELADLEPCHEAAQIEVMRRLLTAGDRAAVVRRFEQLARCLSEELGLEPGPDAVAVHDAALTGTADSTGATATLAGAAAHHGPPVHGRSDEAQQVLDLLSRERVVTIVGPGGIGKTHLASALVEPLSAGSTRRVVVGSLGRADDEAAAAQELLNALGTRRQADTDEVESIVRSLGDDDAVLVLDNCEHLVDEVRSLLSAVLGSCPGSRVLATSRLPLAIEGERILRLGPLPRTAAVELFIDEAARHDVTVDQDSPHVDRICASLDDLPLALRLAAARSRSTDLDTLTGLLQRDLTMIEDDTPTGHARTLRETVAWSFDALDPATRAALGTLSAFAERFDLDGARAVIGDVSENAALRVLDDLVAASLVTVERQPESTRYRLPDAIRYFARRDGLDDDARRRHLAHVRARAERADELLSNDSAAGLVAFDEIWSDLRLAMATAEDLGELDDARRIIAACATHANSCSAFDLLGWCERIVDPHQPPGDGAHAAALAAWSVMLVHRLELDRAAALLELIPGQFRHEPAIAFARGWLRYGADDAAGADAVFDEMLARPDVPVAIESGTLTLLTAYRWTLGEDVGGLAHRVGVLAAGRGPVLEAQALFTTGMPLLWTETADAISHFERAADLADRHQQFNLAFGIRAARALALGIGGQPDDALAALRENLRWTYQHGVWTLAMAGLATASLMLDGIGHTDLAVSLASARDANGFVSGFTSELIKDMTNRARQEHGAAFDSWWAAGERLDTRGATSFAIDTIDRLLQDPDDPPAS